MTTGEEDKIRELAARLARLFAGRCSTEAVERAVDETYSSFGDARIRNFLPILVERGAKDRLREGSASAE